MRWYETRKVLQWWEERHAEVDRHRAEAIRDGLLQELFALRRQLELPAATDHPGNREDWLTTAEHIYTALRQLSENLDAPFLQESLPLAIQSAVERLQPHYPQLEIDLNLPPDWDYRAIQQNRVLLSGLMECLKIVIANDSLPTLLQIQLQQQGQWGELLVQAVYPHQGTSDSRTMDAQLQPISGYLKLLLSARCQTQWQTDRWQWRCC